MTDAEGATVETKCVAMLLDDLAALVTELEAACIGAGYELKDCYPSE